MTKLCFYFNLASVSFTFGSAKIVYGSFSSLSRNPLAWIEGRELNNNNNNNNNKNNQELAWIADYDITFKGCNSTSAYQNDLGFRKLLLAKFQLCPSGSGSTCKNGGDYVVSMQDFVEAYAYAKMNANQFLCTNAYETCGNSCNGAGYYDTCLTNCFSSSGADYSYCSTYYPNGNHNNKNNKNNDFEVWKYVDCNQINGEGNNKDNHNNYNNNYNDVGYYIGAYCSEKGDAVYLGLYTDWRCTVSSSVSDYETLTGYALPYTSTTIVGSESLGCKSYNNNNNNNNNEGNNALEICQKVYQAAAKCEENLDISNPDTSSCPYVMNGVSQISKAMANNYDVVPSPMTRSSIAANVFAVLFGITTLLCGAYIYYARQILHRRRRSALIIKNSIPAQKIGGEGIA